VDPDLKNLILTGSESLVPTVVEIRRKKIKKLYSVAIEDYLGCRMEKNLMGKESWSKLGFADLDKNA
jgi:hypothetical protein